MSLGCLTPFAIHIAIDSTAVRISEALEVLSKLGSRLGKVGKADLGTLTSKLAAMSSLDFSLTVRTRMHPPRP